MSSGDMDFIEGIVERICWALDIKCTKLIDKGTDLVEVFTDEAQTMIDIMVDEMEDLQK